MSFPRAARTLLSSTRRYSTAPSGASKSSNLPLYLGGAGIAGLAGYLYLQSGSKAAAATPAQTQTKTPLDPERYIDLELKAIRPYNHNTAHFDFALPDNQASLLPVASCVLVQTAGDGLAIQDNKGQPVHRPYTPVSPSDAPGVFTLLVKRYEEGKMSKHIHDLKPGDKLAIKGPIMKIPYKANEFDQIGMIAGGSGITPMYQVLQHALRDPANKTKFTLIFANVAERDILYREQFDALQKAHPNTFSVVYALDKPDAGWTGAKGYVNRELITKHIAPASLGDKVKVFICGPPGQVASLAGKKDGMQQGALGGVLKELRYTENQVFKF
ncbi:NADH-cytochrome b5 reductase 2 [Sparassis crispa]|uniref:NADH-cytochrome b5 reductase n=1 Tax=Sparassis crispa TaxID=139825 RepID=A0A401G4L5_9APHY|nr:NADH-cytochrome b5 reductase 2 [Sparassis crispa]GBE77136.1 NADH-cytochrome b5 reductase 2 [Sparassis crispa]